MYDRRFNLQLGFHGCDESIRDNLINNPDNIEISQSTHDWLGHGFYIWENNYTRALDFAKDKVKRSGIKKPSIIGVVYELGECIDLTDQKYTEFMANSYRLMVQSMLSKGLKIPENRNVSSDAYNDTLIRELDCAVIEFFNELVNVFKPIQGLIDDNNVITNYDSVRGAFWEGGPAYPGGGIYKKAHIQICIRNLKCIKGFFKPRG